MKTYFYVLIALLFLQACGGKENKTKQEVRRPNVLVILADDLGVHDLSFAGSKYYETPNIDAIAEEGTQFTQGYAACQVCSPSRASILTGQYTTRHGVTTWIGDAAGDAWIKNHNTKLVPPSYAQGLEADDITIAEAMKANGYKTFFAGKWHVGGEGSTPEDNGFDINIGGWDVGSPKGGYYAPWDNPKLDYKYDGENLTKRLALETADFITENKDDPFFAYLSFYAVHGPIETTREKWNKYRNKAEAKGIAESGYEMERLMPIRTVQDNPIYAGLVESMDDAIGIVLDRLKELGLDDNTIVIFTSDNGGVASGDAFSTTNFPLRGGKGYQWEGGIREAYLIKAPMLEKRISKVDYPVSGIDLYPTIMDLTGVSLNPNHTVDGISLVPLLRGDELDVRPLFWHYPHYGNQGGEPVSIIRKEQYKLIHYWEDGHDELYDLSNDPMEQKDILAENKSVSVELRAELRAELDNFLLDTNAKIPTVNENYDDEKAKRLRAQRQEKLLPNLEKQRKDMLKKDFEPNKDWYNSSLTKD